MSKINFSLSEFNISGKPIPEDVCDKILKWHIQPMQRVRNVFKKAIWPSQESGYRSPAWEKSKGRNGNSRHTFKGKGAVDWTCSQFTKNNKDLLNLIIEHTDYTRMAVYSSFIHCDYKATSDGQRQVFESTPNSKWTFVKNV